MISLQSDVTMVADLHLNKSKTKCMLRVNVWLKTVWPLFSLVLIAPSLALYSCAKKKRLVYTVGKHKNHSGKLVHFLS